MQAVEAVQEDRVVPLVEAPRSSRGAARQHVHHHDCARTAQLQGPREGSNVRGINGRASVAVLVHGESVDPHRSVVGGAAEKIEDRIDEFQKGAFPSVRDEVGRRCDVGRVDEGGAVCEARGPRHGGVFNPPNKISITFMRVQMAQVGCRNGTHALVTC